MEMQKGLLGSRSGDGTLRSPWRVGVGKRKRKRRGRRKREREAWKENSKLLKPTNYVLLKLLKNPSQNFIHRLN